MESLSMCTLISASGRCGWACVCVGVGVGVGVGGWTLGGRVRVGGAETQ